MTARVAQGGFSLLEVLVAFAILSLALGVLLQVFATGLRNESLAEEYSQAAQYAESILAAYGRETPLGEGTREGSINDRFSWRGTVSAYGEGLPDPEKMRMRAFRIQVEVFWNGSTQTRSVRLETLRLAPLEAGTR